MYADKCLPSCERIFDSTNWRLFCDGMRMQRARTKKNITKHKRQRQRQKEQWDEEKNKKKNESSNTTPIRLWGTYTFTNRHDEIVIIHKNWRKVSIVLLVLTSSLPPLAVTNAIETEYCFTLHLSVGYGWLPGSMVFMCYHCTTPCVWLQPASQSVSQCALSSAFFVKSKKKKQKISLLMVCWQFQYECMCMLFLYIFFFSLSVAHRLCHHCTCLLGFTNFLFWCASLWTFSGVTENIYFSVRNSIVCVSVVYVLFSYFFSSSLPSSYFYFFVRLSAFFHFSAEFQVLGFVCRKREKKNTVVDGEDENFLANIILSTVYGCHLQDDSCRHGQPAYRFSNIKHENALFLIKKLNFL